MIKETMMDDELSNLTNVLDSCQITTSLLLQRSRAYKKSKKYILAVKDLINGLKIDAQDNSILLELQEITMMLSLDELISNIEPLDLLEILDKFIQNFINASLQDWGRLLDIVQKDGSVSKLWLRVLFRLSQLNSNLCFQILQLKPLLVSDNMVDLELQMMELDILSGLVAFPEVRVKLWDCTTSQCLIQVRQRSAIMLIQAIKSNQDALEFFRGSELTIMLRFIKENSKDLLPLLMIQLWKGVKDDNSKEFKAHIFKFLEWQMDSGLAIDKEFGFMILENLFQVAHTLALEFFQRDGFLYSLMDCIENERESVQIAILRVISNASFDSTCHELISSVGKDFLNSCINQTSNLEKKSLAASILCKLSPPDENSKDQSIEGESDKILDFMIENILSNGDISTKNYPVEGLALKSLQPKIRELLIDREDVIRQLCHLCELSSQDKSLLYGIVSILSNIGKYKERLSQEQQQVKKLQEMSKGNGAPREDPLENDAAVEKRNRKLLELGVMEAIIPLCKANPSSALSDGISQLLLNLTVDKLNRGKIIQKGGLRGLLLLQKSVTPQGLKDSSQAISKLLITTDPSLAFKGVSGLEFVKPLIDLCRGEDLLCQFESLLALTNLASVGPDVQSRIIQGEAIKTFESLIFSDNIMIRRASTELICNLMYSPSVFDRYVNCGNSSRLKLMVALSDCEDYETKRAASGVLAILSSSKEGTLSLSNEKRFFDVLEALLNQDSLELLHRSFEILKNCTFFIPSKVPDRILTCAQKALTIQVNNKSPLAPLALEILPQVLKK